MRPDAGVEARRRLAGLEAREAEDALLGLAGRPVVEDLLVRARRDARPPAAAARPGRRARCRPRRACRGAPDGQAATHAGIQAVVADARQVEEHQPLDREQLLRARRRSGRPGSDRSRRRPAIRPDRRPSSDPPRDRSCFPVISEIGRAVGWSSPCGRIEQIAGSRRSTARSSRPCVGMVRMVEDVGDDRARGRSTCSRRSAVAPLPPAAVLRPGPPTASDSRCRAWSRRCSTTCIRRPCGRSRRSCRQCCRCGSRCTCRGERPSTSWDRTFMSAPGHHVDPASLRTSTCVSRLQPTGPQ